ncbi:MAG TPA: hypothetical protein VD790_06105 [Thermoleophilaceae bacterium]|nr:hypothetical protein [Thermoleophilaceae bacterium]
MLIALGGCGSDDDEPAAQADAEQGGVVDVSGTDPVGQMVAGSVAALASCRDWKGANEKERLATIADIRAQLAPQTDGLEIPQLTDEEAAEVFDNACEPGWAGGLRLYKLYAQAAGFVTLKRVADGDDGR